MTASTCCFCIHFNWISFLPRRHGMCFHVNLHRPHGSRRPHLRLICLLDLLVVCICADVRSRTSAPLSGGFVRNLNCSRMLMTILGRISMLMKIMIIMVSSGVLVSAGNSREIWPNFVFMVVGACGVGFPRSARLRARS